MVEIVENEIMFQDAPQFAVMGFGAKLLVPFWYAQPKPIKVPFVRLTDISAYYIGLAFDILEGYLLNLYPFGMVNGHWEYRHELECYEVFAVNKYYVKCGTADYTEYDHAQE